MAGEIPFSVVPRLRMMRPELTEREQRVLTHLLENVDSADELRITRIADELNVSEAMVVKMAKKLGFTGFRELKVELKKYGSSQVAELFEEVTPGDAPPVVLRKLFRASIQALEETLSIIDSDHFERAVDLFARASTRDIYGVGGSSAIARDAAHKFLRIGIRCNSYDDAHMMAMSASILTPGDLVFVISHSGQSTVVLDAVRIAQARGTPIIALTSYEKSSIARAADATLVSTARSSPFTGENAAARIAQLNIIDALFVSVALRNPDLATDNLKLTMSAVEEKRE